MHWIRSVCVIVPLSIELKVFYHMSTEICCKQTWQKKNGPSKTRKNLMSLAAVIGHTNFITGDESKRLQFSAELWR